MFFLFHIIVIYSVLIVQNLFSALIVFPKHFVVFSWVFVIWILAKYFLEHKRFKVFDGLILVHFDWVVHFLRLFNIHNECDFSIEQALNDFFVFIGDIEGWLFDWVIDLFFTGKNGRRLLLFRALFGYDVFWGFLFGFLSLVRSVEYGVLLRRRRGFHSSRAQPNRVGKLFRAFGVKFFGEFVPIDLLRFEIGYLQFVIESTC